MLINRKKIKVVAFDADDTLWENENFFRDAEKEFYHLMHSYANKEKLEKLLFSIETGHLELYGYGIKSFVLSMIETALTISNNKISADKIEQIINIGKKMHKHPVKLLTGVVSALELLEDQHYQIIVATKGDLLDQERKLNESGLLHFFHHIEVMTDKKESNYTKLFKKLNIKPHEFLMIGNSLKSDILPVLKLGGEAIHIPYHTTWEHEVLHQSEINHFDYIKIDSLKQLKI